MKTIAQTHSPLFGSLRAWLRTIFDVAPHGYDATQIEAAVAASGYPSGA